MPDFGLPGGIAPGFNPTHIAAQLTQLSVIAQGGNMIDLLTGNRGTITGAPTSVMSAVGPTTSFPASADVVTFANKATGAKTGYTIGCIAIFDVVGAASQTLVSSSNSSAGMRLIAFNSTGSKLTLAVNGFSTFTSTIPIVANVPYALLGSYAQSGANGTFNVALTRLDNGSMQSQTSTIASTAPTADTGTCAVGNRGSALQAQAHIAAAMYSIAYTPMPQLLQWAADPWAFWYPR